MSREDQTKLCVVEKPNGTLLKMVPFGATFTSGSKPGRCWSATTMRENVIFVPAAAAGCNAAEALPKPGRAPAAAISAMTGTSIIGRKLRLRMTPPAKGTTRRRTERVATASPDRSWTGPVDPPWPARPAT